MAIRINQNILSLLVQRNLTRSTGNVEQALDRLSSGEKIRRSADDPAGLSSSQQLRYEIRGLRRNQQNVSGATSMIGSAEAGLEGIVTALQRGRELLVQAANETLGPENRASIQEELTQILSEIDRSASSTEYLGRKLLNGAFTSQDIQVGTSEGQKLTLSISDFRTAALGVIARATGVNGAGGGPIVGGGDLTINGVAVPASSPDNVSYVDPVTDRSDESAIAKARAINLVSSQTGVRASAEPAVYLAAGATISAVALDGIANRLSINGVSIGPTTILPGDSNGELVRAINLTTGSTGVTATVDASGALLLEAADGRNIEIETTGSVADELGLAAADSDLDTVAFGKLRLESDEPFTVGGNPALIGFGAGQTSIGMDPTSAIGNASALSAEAAASSLATVDAAIRQVSTTRAELGSVQNRLESVGSDLDRRIEELTAADSRIRDTDFAMETARLTQAQIMQEAALALLTQANVSPRSALELLQR